MHDPAGLRLQMKDLADRLKRPEVAVYGWSGSIKGVSTLSRMGALPAANFQRSTGDMTYQVLGHRLLQGTDKLRHGCIGCPVKCEHRFERPHAHGGSRAVRLEYQSVYALGPLCGIDDLPAIVDSAALCDSPGIDTVSMGATIAWAMESFERGILTAEQTGGLELTFGNTAALTECIEQTARREGFGALLAGGSLRTARSLGGGSEAWTMQVKGLEMPGYDPRHHSGLGMGLAMSARGACHNRAGLGLDVDPLPGDPTAPADSESTPAGGISREDRQSLLDALGICKCFRCAFDDLPVETAALLTAVSGPGGAAAEFARLPARVPSPGDSFIYAKGWHPPMILWPARLLDQSGDGSNGSDFHKERTAYYRERGWTEAGEVPFSALAALGMEDFAIEARAHPD
jgi:aldehyde:ferredoxin oxidoreductase